MSENAGGQGPSSTSEKKSTTPPKETPKPGAANATAAPKGNPAFRAIGLPNLRLRLPSRNWTIFLTIVGSFTAAITYDRRQKKAVQKKWCTLVEHVAKESLPTNSLARRVTIVLAAPPGDSLRIPREHFTEYVKPVLVAGALDWDVIEGRREGEVRAGVAERIRRLRRKNGEIAETPLERDTAIAMAEMRERTGIKEYNGESGDLVIGRHSWKEYVRGLHEGWLGPIDPPKSLETSTQSNSDTPPSPSNPPDQSSPADSDSQTPSQSTDDASPTSNSNAEAGSDTTPPTQDPKKEEEKKKDEKPSKPPVPPPHNSPSSYGSSSLPRSCPSELSGSIPISFPHMLGVLNTPVRLYRFLTRRYLADEVGRQTAAAVLAAHRPFHHGDDGPAPVGSEFSAETPDDSPESGSSGGGGEKWEQQSVLVHEEREWYKKACKRVEGEGERVWLDDMVIDARIGARMRKFEVEPGEEERARRIGKGAAGIPGRRAGDNGGLEKGGDEQE